MKFASTFLTFTLWATTVHAFAPRMAEGMLATHPVSSFALTLSLTTDANTENIQDMIQSDKLLDTYNQQVTNELKASQLYLSASLWCERCELVGMADFMRRESNEERQHTCQFIEFANKRNMPLLLQTLDAPPHTWDSVTHLWECLLEAEQANTQALQHLGQVAAAAAAAAAEQESADAMLLSTFLDPFYMEQMESENELNKMIANKVRDMENTPGLLRQLDSEIGE